MLNGGIYGFINGTTAHSGVAIQTEIATINYFHMRVLCLK